MAARKSTMVRATFNVRNMVCNCCIRLLRLELNIDGIVLHDVRLGTIDLSFDPAVITRKEIEKRLEDSGFGIITDKEKLLVEQIRQALIELVQHTTYNAMVRNSDYLVERFGMSYPYLSSLFSKHEKTTLEKYTILLKIEKVKELILYGDLTLSEIAYMMGYSSVQYLSTQFRAVTGVSVTDFRANPVVERKSPEEL